MWSFPFRNIFEAKEPHLLASVALDVGWLKSMPLLTLVDSAHRQKQQLVRLYSGMDHRIPVSLIYEQGEINLKELLLFVSLFLPDSDMTEPEGILYCSLHSSLPIPLANTIPLESISNHSVHIETQS